MGTHGKPYIRPRVQQVTVIIIVGPKGEVVLSIVGGFPLPETYYLIRDGLVRRIPMGLVERPRPVTNLTITGFNYQVSVVLCGLVV